MKTLKALSIGIQSSNRSYRMIILLYAVNFLFAAILAWGFRSVLLKTIGGSMSLEHLVKDFDFAVYSDFMFKHGEAISAITSEASWMIFFYLLFNTLVGGGIISTLKNSEEKFSLKSFFENCGLYFFRFFRLLLIFGAILFLVGAIAGMVFGVLYSAFTAGAVSEVFPFTLAIILFLLFLFIVMLITLMADYAKVATVVNEARSMLKMAWQGISFVFRHFLSTVTFQLMLVAILGVAVWIYLVLESQIGMATPLTILLMVFIQQISVGFKVWTRIAAYGGELNLIEAFPVSVPEPAPSHTPPPSEAMPAPVPAPSPSPIASSKPEKVRKARTRTTVRKPPARQKRTRKSR